MSSGNVEHATCNLACRCPAREQVRLDGVVNVCEITALSAIAKNCRLLSLKHLSNEFCQHTRIGRTGILPRSKNIEVAQADCLQPVAAVKRNHVILARQLCDRVWRKWIRGLVLVLGECGRVAVYGRRCGIDNALDLSITS